MKRRRNSNKSTFFHFIVWTNSRVFGIVHRSLELIALYHQLQNKWYPHKCFPTHFEATLDFSQANLLAHNLCLCYYGQVNLLRLKSSVSSKWACKNIWGYYLFCYWWYNSCRHLGAHRQELLSKCLLDLQPHQSSNKFIYKEMHSHLDLLDSVTDKTRI